jgi:hypothetical protein
MLIIINTALYLLFISVVLAFHFSTEVASGACGGRVAPSYTNSIDNQRIISEVYAVMMGIISLALGIGFIIFGKRLGTAMHWDAQATPYSTKVRV